MDQSRCSAGERYRPGIRAISGGSGVRIGSLPTSPAEANRSSGREVTKRTGYRLNLGCYLAGEVQLFALRQGPPMIAAMSRSGSYPGAVVELA
jgi:hypothetical protein